jgi:hypothetical protein
LIIICFTSCTSSRKSSAGSNPVSGGSNTVQYVKQDGLSMKTAVIVNKKTESPGVAAEYAWIKKNYSDYKVISQSLSSSDNRQYDIITIRFSDGKELKLYFDITKFFGKF